MLTLLVPACFFKKTQAISECGNLVITLAFFFFFSSWPHTRVHLTNVTSIKHTHGSNFMLHIDVSRQRVAFSAERPEPPDSFVLILHKRFFRPATIPWAMGCLWTEHRKHTSPGINLICGGQSSSSHSLWGRFLYPAGPSQVSGL